MPNLDFYAVGSDFDDILAYVFDSSGCRVFESYSAFGHELIEFNSVGSLKQKLAVGVCSHDAESVLLQLVVPTATPLIHIRKLELSPDKCDGHNFRYEIEGWGLIQLYFGGIGPKGVVASHTNHNTQARALAWEATTPQLGSVNAWDWADVSSVSSRLNRFIRRHLSAGKLGTRPVLRAAHAAFEGGLPPADRFGRAAHERNDLLAVV